MYIVKSIDSLSLFDLSTGEKVCDVQSLKEPILTPQLSANSEREISLSLDNVQFEPETLEMLLNQNSVNPKYKIELNGYRVVYVQKRKHKKKRINKKWLKRYGYKEVYIPFNMSLKNCTITQDEFDKNMYSIEGNI